MNLLEILQGPDPPVLRAAELVRSWAAASLAEEELRLPNSNKLGFWISVTNNIATRSSRVRERLELSGLEGRNLGQVRTDGVARLVIQATYVDV
eukprot:1185817-Prorocentrum_minimum.AAC.1